MEATRTLLKSSLAFVAAVLERVTRHLKVHLNYSSPYDHVVIKQCSMFKQCFLLTECKLKEAFFLHQVSKHITRDRVHDLFLQQHVHYYGEDFTCVSV